MRKWITFHPIPSLIRYLLAGLVCGGMLETMASPDSEHVILLHGLMRGPGSMEKMADALTKAGYSVDNRAYPSRERPIMDLAETTIGAALATPEALEAKRIHFVTHSMGGILVRVWLGRHRPEKPGRVVMLAPPNQGSEVVDRLRDWRVFAWLNGPAGQELGTGKESLPTQLGPVDFPLGVIAGDRSINWINSTMLPGEDDGKVTVEGTKVEGMTDHLVIHVTHPYIMKNPDVIAQTRAFLGKGRFDR